MSSLCLTVLLSFASLTALKGGVMGSAMEDKLIVDLLDKNNYNKLTRPVLNHTDTVNIELGISIRQIVQLDEVNGRFSTSVWRKIVWTDYRLRWNPNEYDGIQRILIPPSKIWLPDIVLFNNVEEEIKNVGTAGDVFLVIVLNNGTCQHFPLAIHVTECQIDINWFPFDDQYCSLTYESWTSSVEVVNLTMLANGPKPNKADLSYISANSAWWILEAPAVREEKYYPSSTYPYSSIKFTVHLRRQILYYVFNMILPCAVISALTCISFLLSPGERIGLGITTLLALSVYQIVILDKIPASSDGVPLISMYFMAQFLITALAICMMIVTDRCHTYAQSRSPPPISRGVYVVIFVVLARIVRIKASPEETPQSNPPKRRKFPAILQTRFHHRTMGLRQADTDQHNNDQTNHDTKNSRRSSGNAKERKIEQNNSSDKRSLSESISGNDMGQQAIGPGDVTSQVLRLLDVITQRLEDLTYLTTAGRNEEEDIVEEEEEEGNWMSPGRRRGMTGKDWKFAALVLDHTCFWVFASSQSLLSVGMMFCGYISRHE